MNFPKSYHNVKPERCQVFVCLHCESWGEMCNGAVYMLAGGAEPRPYAHFSYHFVWADVGIGPYGIHQTVS